jgi:hypothetical protein
LDDSTAPDSPDRDNEPPTDESPLNDDAALTLTDPPSDPDPARTDTDPPDDAPEPADTDTLPDAPDALSPDKIVTDPEALTRYTTRQIIELAGSQGVELMTWIAMRGALQGRVRKMTSAYQVPISNTGGAIMLMQNDPVPAQLAAE